MTANEEFSTQVREVGHGEGVLIARRGRPTAGLVAHGADKLVDPEWVAAYRRRMALLDEGASLGGLKVRREEIHER